MFSTFHNELQYIFLEKNFNFMVFLAVKDVGTDVIFGNSNEISFVSSYKNDLNDVSSCIFNSQKDHEDFLQENILQFVVKCTKHLKYAESENALYAL